MTVLPAAIDLIKNAEGCRSEAYLDANGIPTIGYGHTGPDVAMGMTCTQGEADAWLAANLDDFDKWVATACPASTPEQHSAMVSLAYNIGIGNFRGSSVCRFHNAGQFDDAAAAFSLWNKAGGKTLPGLVARRKAEAALYASSVGEESHAAVA